MFRLSVKEEQAVRFLKGLSTGTALRRSCVAGMSSFISPTHNMFGWGYGPVVQSPVRERFSGWRTFEIDLPKGVRDADVYGGTSLSNESRVVAEAISGTLSWIFNFLEYLPDGMKDRSASEYQQAVAVIGFLNAGFHSENGLNDGSLAFRVAPRVLEWLRGLTDQERIWITKLTKKAIATAYRQMMGQRAEEGGDFMSVNVHLHPDGRIFLQTIGNCACLGVNNGRVEEDGSCELSPHNIDGAIQQLSLLAGVATFAEQYHLATTKL